MDNFERIDELEEQLEAANAKIEQMQAVLNRARYFIAEQQADWGERPYDAAITLLNDIDKVMKGTQ